MDVRGYEMQLAEAQDRLAEQRGLVRDLTSSLENRNAEITRLRAALEPFAVLGRRLTPAAESGAIPAGASAHYLKLEPLISQHFIDAAKAVDTA